MNPRVPFLLSLFLALASSAQAQSLREVECGTTVTVSGETPITSLKNIVDRTDLVVHATIGSGASHLSADATKIYTTFELISPRILFVTSRLSRDVSGAGQRLVIAQLGGEIYRDGDPDCRLSMGYSHQARLTPGTEAILLATEQSGLFYAFAGVFEVRRSAIDPPILPHFQDAAQFKDMPVDRFIEHVLRLKNTR
jgi:hypothetical protein